MYEHSKSGKSMLRPLEKLNDSDVRQKHSKTNPYAYISYGDYLYFVSRISFLQRLGIISFFHIQQALENYLKGYILFLGNKKMKNIHDLVDLLDAVQKLTDEPFFHSDECAAILRYFNPFNEISRYPLPKKRPKDGTWGYTYPDLIYYLDYFVYELRKVYSVPEGSWDLFEEGYPFEYNHQLALGADTDLVGLFKLNNINFR